MIKKLPLCFFLLLSAVPLAVFAGDVASTDGRIGVAAGTAPGAEAKENMRELQEWRKNLAPLIWYIRKSTSKMDDSPGIVMWADAQESVAYNQTEVVPQLVISCQENKTRVILDAKDFIQARNFKSLIKWRIDDNLPETGLWPEGMGNDSAHAPNPVALARALSKGSRFRIEYAPHRSSPVVAEFSLEGIDKGLTEVAATCGWKL